MAKQTNNTTEKKERRRLIIVAFFSTFICFFNQTTVNPAFPTIMHDFGVQASTAQWLLSGYLMIMAIVIPINAFLLHKFNVKNICIFAMGIYTIGCILTGLGINFSLTLAGRILQGIGHGILMPTCMAVMLFIFPVEKRGMVLGFYGLLIGFAPIFGPTYSGIVIDNLGWRYAFYFIAIFAFICFLGCIFLMPKKKIDEGTAQKLDIPSIVLSTVGLGLILFGSSEIGTEGFTVWVAFLIVTGLCVCTIFIIRQTKIANPMLQMKVFKSRNFCVSMILMATCQLVFMGAVVLFPFLIQDVLGKTPTISGLVMIPSAIVMGIMSPITGRWFDKHGLRAIAIFGLTLLAIAGFCLSNLTLASPIWLLICFLCLRNFAASCIMMNTNTWGINSLPMELLPDGNAVASTVRQIAMSFGASISTTVYAFVSNLLPGGIDNPAAGIIGINSSFMYQTVLTVIALIVCLIFVRDKKKSK